MKPLHPRHCSLLWSHASPGDWCSNTAKCCCLRVLSAAPWVLSALIMGSAHFSKPTCQQHMPLQHSSPKASAPYSATVTEFCTAAWGKFCPVLIEGAEPSLLSHLFQFGSYQRISKISSYQCTFSQLFVQWSFHFYSSSPPFPLTMH